MAIRVGFVHSPDGLKRRRAECALSVRRLEAASDKAIGSPLAGRSGHDTRAASARKGPGWIAVLAAWQRYTAETTNTLAREGRAIRPGNIFMSRATLCPWQRRSGMFLEYAGR